MVLQYRVTVPVAAKDAREEMIRKVLAGFAGSHSGYEFTHCSHRLEATGSLAKSVTEYILDRPGIPLAYVAIENSHFKAYRRKLECPAQFHIEVRNDRMSDLFRELTKAD